MNIKEYIRRSILSEIAILAVGCYVSTKIVKALYIFAHNLFEEEQWGYHSVFSGLFYNPTIGKLISHLCLAPLIETIIFCSILSRITRMIKLGDVLFVLVSATLFATSHLAKPGAGSYTFIYTFIVGAILATYYRDKDKKVGENTAFFSTVSIHSIGNALLILL